MGHRIVSVGLLYYRILNKNNAVLDFGDRVASQIRSLVILLYGALDNGLGLKYCQYVLLQPISPDFFDASLLLRYLPETSSPESEMAVIGVSHGSLVVVRVRRAEEFDARPESLRYN